MLMMHPARFFRTEAAKEECLASRKTFTLTRCTRQSYLWYSTWVRITIEHVCQWPSIPPACGKDFSISKRYGRHSRREYLSDTHSSAIHTATFTRANKRKASCS